MLIHISNYEPSYFILLCNDQDGRHFWPVAHAAMVPVSGRLCPWAFVFRNRKSINVTCLRKIQLHCLIDWLVRKSWKTCGVSDRIDLMTCWVTPLNVNIKVQLNLTYWIAGHYTLLRFRYMKSEMTTWWNMAERITSSQTRMLAKRLFACNLGLYC